MLQHVLQEIHHLDGDNHADLPCLMAGKLGGAFKTGRHIQYKLDTPMSNVLLTILDSVGVHIDRIGDSTGRLVEPISI